VAVTERAMGLLLTPARLRVWGWRSAISLVDQGLTSGASFAANLLLARWLAPSLYGAFALAFAGFLLVTGFHNVIFLEPMTVYGASRYREDLSEYFAANLRAHVIVTGALSAVVSVFGAIWWAWDSRSPLGPVTVAVGIGLPFLLLFWMARRMCYVVQNPRLAAGASGFYFVLLFGGMFAIKAFGWISPANTILLMAGASLCAALLVFRRLWITWRIGESAAHPIRRLLGENWQYGRWLTLTNALSWTTVQAQAFFVGATLGLAGAGALRAMQLPSLLMMQVISATSLLVLPNLSHELGKGNVKLLRQKAVTSSALLATLGISFAAILFLIAPSLERILFSGRYGSAAWLMPVLGLAPVFTGFSSSLSFVLRMCGRTQYELLAYAVSSVTAVLLAITLMPHWGLAGAAASIVGSTAVLSAAVWICYMRVGFPILESASFEPGDVRLVPPAVPNSGEDQ
jgi:O-antigen/teichoic acid export membrane protein